MVDIDEVLCQQRDDSAWRSCAASGVEFSRMRVTFCVIVSCGCCRWCAPFAKSTWRPIRLPSRTAGCSSSSMMRGRSWRRQQTAPLTSLLVTWQTLSLAAPATRSVDAAAFRAEPPRRIRKNWHPTGSLVPVAGAVGRPTVNLECHCLCPACSCTLRSFTRRWSSRSLRRAGSSSPRAALLECCQRHRCRVVLPGCRVD